MITLTFEKSLKVIIVQWNHTMLVDPIVRNFDKENKHLNIKFITFLICIHFVDEMKKNHGSRDYDMIYCLLWFCFSCHVAEQSILAIGIAFRMPSNNNKKSVNKILVLRCFYIYFNCYRLPGAIYNLLCECVHETCFGVSLSLCVCGCFIHIEMQKQLFLWLSIFQFPLKIFRSNWTTSSNSRPNIITSHQIKIHHEQYRFQCALIWSLSAFYFCTWFACRIFNYIHIIQCSTRSW